MIFIVYRYNYKQYIEDRLIHHLLLIDRGLLTLYDPLEEKAK